MTRSSGFETGLGPDVIVQMVGYRGVTAWGLANIGGDGSRVRSTGLLGSIYLELEPATRRSVETIAVTRFTDLEPGEIAATLLFFPAVDLNLITEGHTVESGSITVTFKTGSGSGSVPLAYAGNEGAAVSADSAGAGASMHNASLPSGIAGVQPHQCELCAGQWTAPDGGTGTWISYGYNQDVRVPLPLPRQIPPHACWEPHGTPSFLGPAGNWSWTFGGVTTAQIGPPVVAGEPVMAAYAPIGDDWTLFPTGGGPADQPRPGLCANDAVTWLQGIDV